MYPWKFVKYVAVVVAVVVVVVLLLNKPQFKTLLNFCYA